MQHATASDAQNGSLIAIALGPVVSAIVVLLLGHDRRLERIPTRRLATP
jgi:hypothetical protein